MLAALRPKMLALAAEVAAGAHTYFAPPEHTARARAIVGPATWIATGQFVMLETDARRARAAARRHIRIYLGLPAYRNNLLGLGFDAADLADGGSDRLVDGVVAWGEADAIRERIAAAQHRAGADHVWIQPLRPDGLPGPDPAALAALAPAGR